MTDIFYVLKSTRKLLAEKLDNYSIEQLVEIPEGFNNNMIWNAAHVISVNQLLTYHQAGMIITEPKRIVYGYKPGSFPEAEVDELFINNVKTRLLTSIDQLEGDYRAGIFKNYKPYQLSSGIMLNTIEEAITFDIFHLGLHTGTIVDIEKRLKSK